METTTIVMITVAVIAGLVLIVVLLKSLILVEMGPGVQEPVRSVLGEDYYVDFTGPGHMLTRTTRTTNIDHLEIRDAPELTDAQRAHQRKKGQK